MENFNPKKYEYSELVFLMLIIYDAWAFLSSWAKIILSKTFCLICVF